jgi:glucokinase
MKAEQKVLGIDVGSTNMKSGLVVGGEISEFRNIPVEPDRVIAQLLELIVSYKLEADSIIGVGFPGFVNEGKVHSPPNLPAIHDVDLQEELRKEIHLPVYLFNDADSYILGESLYG